MAAAAAAAAVVLLLPLLHPAQSLTFTFPTGNQSLNFQGNASLSAGGAINLTSPSNSTAGASFGRAVLPVPVPAWEPGSLAFTNFTSSFSFVLGDARDDGFAFFLGPYLSVATASTGGEYAALFNGTTVDTIQPDAIVAIVIDRLAEDGKDPAKINNYSVSTWTQNSSFSVGVVGTAMIAYDSIGKKLTVNVSYPPSSPAVGAKNVSFAQVINLQEALPKEVAVGFSTAVHGASATPHRILSWNFSSTLVPQVEPANSMSNNVVAIAVGAGIGGVALVALAALAAFLVLRRRSRQEEEEEAAFDMIDDDTANGPRKFTFSSLRAATRNFAADQKLGSGGFGTVYRGLLTTTDPPTAVAVKRVSRTSRQGRTEYIAEVKTIRRIRHRNLVRLIGFCHERGEMLLVYEFIPNGSLDEHLHGGLRPLLSWDDKRRIVSGLASAVMYLHEECEQGIVHRDIKPSNVMLDGDLTPKLSDFGLAKLVEHERGGVTTEHLTGTRGYMDYAFWTSGVASKALDIYSLGVVMLEVATGWKPLLVAQEKYCAGLVEWVWRHYEQGKLLDAAAKGVAFDGDGELIYKRLVVVGLWCGHPDMAQRPSIKQVVNALDLDGQLPELPPAMPVPVYWAPSLPRALEVESANNVSTSMLLGPSSGR